jgi:glucose/arabinose dehydrogenase
MHRPSARLLIVGTIIGVAVIGSSFRADATPTPAQQHMLASRAQAATAADVTLPAGFQESIAFDGLAFPTAFRFSPDGRVFVAQQSGVIKVFDSLSDTTPTVFADLGNEVDHYWDRGLLGLALDPNFPTTPYVYALYTYDAGPGQNPPVWNDACPKPPGPTTDGCVVTARLSRLTASGDTMTGEEQVLLTGWCQQFPSHSIGDLEFGPDGALYVSGGDGASFTNVDIGQWGGTLPSSQNPVTPKNPCGDPPAGLGGNESAPSAEGGALRSLSLHRLAGPTLLNGTVLRVDPATGDAMPDNPLAASSDPVAQRIVAEGLRNPFRFALRPGTDDLWVGDVGWSDWEEINRNPTPKTTVANFGWPCYEGNGHQGGYEGFSIDICSNLYDLESSNNPSRARAPYYRYNHDNSVVTGDGCSTGSSSITGMAFYASGTYPSSYSGALFFADHSRNCIWVMREGSNGLPDPTKLAAFVSPAAGPVDLVIGPGGDLFYAGYDDGTIRRIQYFSGNQPPIVAAAATPKNGAAPLTVHFDASASHDPDPGDTLSFSWDLDGDGTFADSTSPTPSFIYQQIGTYHPSVRVSDNNGSTTRSSLFTISAGNAPPVPVIDSPDPSLTWAVGDPIEFSGHADDAQDGTEPASRLNWSVIVHHCPSNCHTHNIQTFSGVAGDSFAAPDHDYPSFLELKLTATDANGLAASTSIELDPKTVDLTLSSKPAGLQLSIGTFSGTAPFTRTVIVNSANSISASDQTLNGRTYLFSTWSDGGANAHVINAPATATQNTATFTRVEHPPIAKFSARPNEGGTPLKVRFNASASTDADGDHLRFSWDLNGDRRFGDSLSMDPKHVYREHGKFTVRLRVRDGHGGSDTATTTIRAQRR